MSDKSNADFAGFIISELSLRPEDLLPKFMQFLTTHAPTYISPMDKKALQILESGKKDGDYTQTNGIDLDEFIHFLTEQINGLAPKNYYFGANPDDGACFGFWPDMDI